MRAAMMTAEEIWVPAQVWTQAELATLRMKARLLGFRFLYFDREWAVEHREYEPRVTWDLERPFPRVGEVWIGKWAATTNDIPF